MKFIPIVFLVSISFSLSAQQIKEQIAWVQYVEKGAEKEILVNQKRVITYNKDGQILSKYFKQPHKNKEFNFDYTTEDYTYDKQGRLILHQEYCRDQTLCRKSVYDYNNDGYYTKKYYEDNLDSARYLTYFYTQKDGLVTEEKEFSIDKHTQKKTLINWYIYTYSKGRLIGKRYKKKPEGISPVPAKEIYEYLPNTDKLSAVLDYRWNEDGTEATTLGFNTMFYTYNDEGQLKMIEEGIRRGADPNTLTMFKYKDGKIWRERKHSSSTPRKMRYQTDKAYKDGVLIRKKDYEFNYKKERNVKALGEEGLESVTNYEYTYYDK